MPSVAVCLNKFYDLRHLFICNVAEGLDAPA